MTERMNNKELSLVVISTLCALCVITALFRVSAISLFPLVELVKRVYMFVNMNAFMPFIVSGKSIFVYLYTGIFTSLVLTGTALVYLRIKRPESLPEVKHAFTVALLALFACVAAIQTISHASIFGREMTAFSGKDERQKKLMVHGLPYMFSEFAHEALPGRHKAVLITDIEDWPDQDHFVLQGRLLYNLLPIDAGDLTKGKDDCMVVFSKKEPTISAELTEKYPTVSIMGNYMAIAVGPETERSDR
ncbi:MAG: hypothetical protein PHH49_06670 [Candidatus Omnitrophica bacterium]|nr:hypothetical protein [Candidatus Omnitrophota bacterium]MDD5488623.1 hypothetical protein [Candidatus Omnitrophota bacterium]